MRVALAVSPDFLTQSFCVLSAFEAANEVAKANVYDLCVVSATGGTVRGSLGFDVQTSPLQDHDYDTLLLSDASEPFEAPAPLTDYLRATAASTRRIVAIGNGAFTAGAAGLLDGKRATTHWRHVNELQHRFPRCAVQADQLFVVDGTFWSSAGMSAATDLALSMIDHDHDREFARAVAAHLVMGSRRAGGQSQRSVLLQLDPTSDRVQRVLTYARNNLHAPLDVEDLARVACLSPRQFTRVFHQETGRSPGKVVKSLRLEKAKLMLEQSRLPIEVIARETGFGDRERMRRAFVREFGEPAQTFRAAAGPLAEY
ncbi:helix-turn-helix domain-containing protein [Mesorhizobium sp. B2-4-17]|uniref:GlxA family transcriptional regulator n=1 Tax=Mesorhizobium sp. B2-4-17 TaxID=2589932 RepID=UPI00112BF88A|nr:helix-turn-helix domain-containing protein [Mesorhizobium sp. B2-4-17]TPK78143.1 helix-turn-helix domain-containing protein [Mesorhizobium sp. B2-4-17]